MDGLWRWPSAPHGKGPEGPFWLGSGRQARVSSGSIRSALRAASSRSQAFFWSGVVGIAGSIAVRSPILVLNPHALRHPILDCHVGQPIFSTVMGHAPARGARRQVRGFWDKETLPCVQSLVCMTAPGDSVRQ